MRLVKPERFKPCLLSLFLALAALLAVCSRRVASEDSPPLGWGVRSAAPGYAQQQGRAVAVDPSGNIYVAGYAVDDTGRAGYAAVKYDPAGFQLWERRYHSAGSDGDYATALALAAGGGLYVTGYATGGDPAFDFTTVHYDADGLLLETRGYNTLCGPGESVSAVTVDAQGNTCVTGAFLDQAAGEPASATLKFDAGGTLLWGQPFGAAADGRRESTALATDSAGNVYVTGYCYDAQRRGAMLTARYDPTGAQVWSRQYDGPRWSEARALVVDAGGSVYVTGSAAGAGSGSDCVTVKYDAEGNQVWARRYAGPAGKDDGAEALAVSGAGEVFVAGWSEDANGHTDCVTLKYAADGTPLWAQPYNGPADGNDEAASLALDATGVCYVTGSSFNGMDTDFATVAYDPSGAPLWSSRYSYFYGPRGTAPPAPCELTAAAVSSTAIRLAWKNVGANGDTFQVERQIGDQEFYLAATLPAGTSEYTDEGLQASTCYVYRVRAVRLGEASRYSLPAATGTMPGAPPAPLNLTAAVLPLPAVLLAWEDSQDEDGYQIERSAAGSDFAPLAEVGADVNEYTDVAVEEAVTYVYRVRAFNFSGGSTSASVTARVPRRTLLLRLDAVGEQEIRLSWLPPETDGAPTTFIVERSPDGTTYMPLNAEPVMATTYTDTGLTQDTLYYYRVRGVLADGPGAPSNAVAVYTLPAAVSDLAVTGVTSTEVRLAWSDRYANELDYRIERSEAGLPFTEIATLPADATAYSDGGLIPDTAYAYRVVVRNPSGTATSNTAAETTLPLPPEAPQALTATAVSQSQINLAWTPVGTNATAFEIERRQGAGDWAPLASAAAGVTQYSDRDLIPDTSYTYRVRAVNRGGASAFSNEATATPPTSAPAPPADLAAVSPSPQQIKLTWTDLPNEAGYRVERRNSALAFVEIAAPPANATTFTDNGLKPLTSYTYRLRAYNAVGSSYSPPVAARTQGCTISGKVTSAEGPVPGVVLSTGTLTTTTAADGTYAFRELPSATYQITPTLAGYVFSPASLRIAVTSVYTTADFAASRLYKITGTVTGNNLPMSGVTIRAAGRLLSTGTDGTYTVSGLVAGTYSVSASKTGYVFAPATLSVTLGPDYAGADFRAVLYTLSGRVTLQGAGLPGVRITAGTRATLTGTDGTYVLDAMTPGAYTVRPYKVGYSFVPTQVYINLTADLPGVNFAATGPPALRSTTPTATKR